MILELKHDFARNFIGDKAHTFNAIMALEGEKYRSLKHRCTIKYTIKNNNYFIKKHFGSSIFEIIKNLISLRAPIINAKPEWLAIKKLHEIKIPTMELIGYGLRGANPLTQKSFIITRELTDTVGLKDICDQWFKNPPTFNFKKKITIALANTIRKMHINGINHRDLYICHFLVDEKHLQQNEINLFVIDLHRAQIRIKVPKRWLIKDLASIYFSALTYKANKTAIFRFLRYYFNNKIKNIFAEHKDLLKKVNKKAWCIYNRECLKNGASGKKRE